MMWNRASMWKNCQTRTVCHSFHLCFFSFQWISADISTLSLPRSNGLKMVEAGAGRYVQNHGPSWSWLLSQCPGKHIFIFLSFAHGAAGLRFLSWCWAGARRLPSPWAGVQHIVALVNRPSYAQRSPARTSILTLGELTPWPLRSRPVDSQPVLCSMPPPTWVPAAIFGRKSIPKDGLFRSYDFGYRFPDLLTMSTGSWKSMFHVLVLQYAGECSDRDVFKIWWLKSHYKPT